MVNLTLLNQQIKTRTCASALVEKLIDIGVDSVFGYPGAAVLSIYNSLSQTDKIKHYLVRHEQAAVHAAEGYARTSGKVGVVLVTSGPGFTNTITGIANAYADSTPLVVLAGDVSSQENCDKVFQKVDIVSMTKTCVKKSYVLDENSDIQQILEEAFVVANSDKKGPVVIVLPRNILELNYKLQKHKILIKKTTSTINPTDLNKFTSLLNNSKQPLILLGAGAKDSVESIRNFVAKTNIPVVSTLMGIGILPSKDEKYLGMIGLNGTYLANSAFANSDLVISLGVSFSDRTTCKNINFSKKTKIININIEKGVQNFELQFESKVQDFLEKLEGLNVELQDFSDWTKKINILREENQLKLGKTDKLHSSSVLEKIYECTKKFNPIIVTDVGQHQMLTAQFFNFNKPRNFLTSGGLGTMGFGLPASIGAQIANPNKLVLNITGDGSFQMNLQELATCREHNIPIKIVIMNNGYLGMVRQLQEKIYQNRYQVEMINPDFTKIAEAYDLLALRVNKIEELESVFDKAIAHNGTVIVDIAIDSFEEI